MTSNRLDKRELILAKGSEVMTRRGYHGTGVLEIVQAARIPKGSFYHYFDSKEAFAQQALEHVYAPRLARYAQALGDSRFSPRERVLRYYGELLEHFARQEKPEYHCFIGSLSFEMAELSPPIAAKVESILQASAQILQDCLEQAREAGELAADEDCASLAGFIGFAWQGAWRASGRRRPRSVECFHVAPGAAAPRLIPARTSHSPQESVHECPRRSPVPTVPSRRPGAAHPCGDGADDPQLFPRAAYPTPRSSSTTAGAPPPASA